MEHNLVDHRFLVLTGEAVYNAAGHPVSLWALVRSGGWHPNAHHHFVFQVADKACNYLPVLRQSVCWHLVRFDRLQD
jgi:hypothetical protein